MSRFWKWIVVAACARVTFAATLACVHCGADISAFPAAAAGANLAFERAMLSGALVRARVIVLDPGAAAPTPQERDALAEFVRRGGSLLIGLGPQSGAVPFSLSSILPTTAWRTNGRAADGAGPDGAIRTAEWDRALFPHDEPRGISLPYHIRMRAVDAVERGEGRYERYARTIPYLKLDAAAGNDFWTRPLLNREWTVRVRGEGVDQIPLLIAGRYGAGRVAVFAASIASIDGAKGAREFWTPILWWLAANAPADAASTQARLEIAPPTVDGNAHAIRIAIANRSASPLSARIVVRAMTWEHALIGDLEAPFDTAAGATASVVIPLPAPSLNGYQAQQVRDAFQLRIGVLSLDGSRLIAETTASADFRPPLDFSVHAADTPHATDLQFPTRMGTPLDAYAYKPGEHLTAEAEIRNGLRNIAPLATAMDESDPANRSAMALNDESAVAEKGPIDAMQAYGTWTGRAGGESVLLFRLPIAARVAAVTLVGASDPYRNYPRHNPGAAEIELDGARVSESSTLDVAFAAGNGRARIEFTPRVAREVRVRLPWLAHQADGGARQAPWLAEIEIDGVLETTAIEGTVEVRLRDALTGERIELGHRAVQLAAGASQGVRFETTLPVSADAHFEILEADFAGRHSETPLIVIAPGEPLAPLSALRPPDAPQIGFIVSRGFRSVFELDTGTREELGGWAQPDDLVYAYSHQLKQIPRNARTLASRLYLSESDLRHYITPWRAFDDGTYFYDLAAQGIVAHMKQQRGWTQSSTVFLSHSDRWDTAPDVDQLHGWQDFIAFDDYLREQHLPGLRGKTRQELATEIHSEHEHLWQHWNLARYQHGLADLRDAFGAENKRVMITAQGSPLAPWNSQQEIAAMVQGQSDDSTWGMIEESVPATTGRQMGVVAFDPEWKMSTLLQWGYDSGTLNNPHWHAPVGTTEPSRRHIYDRAFRGVVLPDGAYHSMHYFAFNTNAGVAYTMNANDWQQAWQMHERHMLIAPEAPIGAGVVISTARFGDPAHAAFSGSGGWGNGEADRSVRAVSTVVRALHEAGISVPFSANIAALEKWNGTAPLILLDVCQFSDAELATVERLVARGVRVAAFTGREALSPAAAKLFANPRTLLLPGAAEDLTGMAALDVAPALDRALELPLAFAPGTSGYGFESQGLRYIVVEDWREEGRTVHIRLRAATAAGSVHAIDVNDHRPLAVTREGAWLSIEVPLRPGDGSLVCVQEAK